MLPLLKAERRPSKKGRHHPGLPCLEQQPQEISVSKKIVLGLILVIVVVRLSLWEFVSERSSVASSLGVKESESRPHLARPGFPEIAELKIRKRDEDRNPGIRVDSDDAALSAAFIPPSGEAPAHGQEEQSRRPVQRRKEPQAPVLFQRSRVAAALARVIHLLPEEMAMRDLLRPLEGTGPQKLRELGLRTRSYREHFQAWEDLHLETGSDGITYIRDDIVQYITQMKPSDTQSLSIFADMPKGQILQQYESYKAFLANLGSLLFPYTSPFFSDHMTLHHQFQRAGKGIVLTAGDDQALFLMTTIYSFRELGCTLPIEVMYLGDSDLSEDYRDKLESIQGVITRDLSPMVADEGWKLAGWAAKAFAILFSSFREVIFIDADSLFLKDPAVLFDDPAYVKTGALFFKDRSMMAESRKRWVQQVLPRPFSSQIKHNRFWTGESAHMQESGVVVVDKWKHFIAMLLVTRMNGPDRDGDKEQGKVGVYDMVYGDKETFWLGWELAGAGKFAYAFHTGGVGTMGLIQEPSLISNEWENTDNLDDRDWSHDTLEEEPAGEVSAPEPSALSNYTICGPQLLHLDLNGRPLWFNGWILDNKFTDKSHRRFAIFESYVVEPRSWNSEKEPWQLEQDNKCCLTTHATLKFDFDPSERKILSMIVERANEVEAESFA